MATIPGCGGCLVLFVASLIGVPPLSGFFGKALIFADALTAGLVPLAIVLAATSILSVYYYLGIAYSAFVAEEGSERAQSARVRPDLAVALVVCSVGVVGAAIFLTPVMNFLTQR